MQALAKRDTIDRFRADLQRRSDMERMKDTVLRFLDVSGTSMGRGSFYNTQRQQQEAEDKLHRDLFEMDRGLYGLMLALPGTTDRTKQLGLATLLSGRGGQTILPDGITATMTKLIITQLPPHRMLKMFKDFRARRINNGSTRRLILRSILDAKKLELWTVKYRRLIRLALEHALGRKISCVIRKILCKPSMSDDDLSFVRKHLKRTTPKVLECVCFALGGTREWHCSLLKSYEAAKTDFSALKRLPTEVAEGLRSVYHRGRTHKQVLELTKHTMTAGQRMVVQRSAKAKGVTVTFNPMDGQYDITRLYIYAAERGLSEVSDAIAKKAKRAADAIPVRYDTVGIIVDCSQSMQGSSKQKLRPVSAAFALRDVLGYTANKRAVCLQAGGRFKPGFPALPEGHTNLARELVDMLEKYKPDCVYIITDGYENQPAGRLSEVVTALRTIGVSIPIMQFSPVFGAESQGVRRLDNTVQAIPFQKAEAMGPGMVKGLIETNPVEGLVALASMALPMIEYKG